jgi:hypothetical protein
VEILVERKNQAQTPVTSTETRERAKERKLTNSKNISPFCDDCRSVMKSEEEDRKTYTDSFGDRWRCYKPFSCDHAIIINARMHSCRVRTSEVRAMKIMMGLE